MLGFEKGDERNVYVGYYSSRIAWVFTSIVLLIWSLQGFLTTGGLPVQFDVLCASQVVFWVSFLFYKRKLGG
ncbi:MAG: hypothetical protein HPY50_08305 [Firmicutes bacterium]|nr:hypothetical protein [Bacillota bacterium]